MSALLALALAALASSALALPAQHVLAVPARLPLALPAAQAQRALSIFGPGSRALSDTSVEVNISGSLAVTFRGDQSNGCAARGLCGYSGVVTWSPGATGASGSLEIRKLRKGRPAVYSAALAVFGNGGNSVATSPVSAFVRRNLAGQGTGTCADASSPPDFRLGLPVHGGSIALGVLGRGSSLLSTRCAGPLDLDVARSIPMRQVAIGAALRGHRRVDLGGTSSFAAGGFTGTVRSTLVLHLGGAQSNAGGGQASPPSSGPRERQVTVPLTLVKASGALTARVQGEANPSVCVLLDSCGASGTLSVQPRPPVSRGGLTAIGPARRPYRDFLTALGLSRHGNAAGIFVGGGIEWQSGGALGEDFTQGGECRASMSLGFGAVLLQRTRKLVRAAYYSGDPLRTRCPGPQLGGFGGNRGGSAGMLASGAISLRSLARRQFSISLRSSASFTDDGYTGQRAGSLSLTFERGRLRQRLVAPSG